MDSVFLLRRHLERYNVPAAGAILWAVGFDERSYELVLPKLYGRVLRFWPEEQHRQPVLDALRRELHYGQLEHQWAGALMDTERALLRVNETDTIKAAECCIYREDAESLSAAVSAFGKEVDNSDLDREAEKYLEGLSFTFPPHPLLTATKRINPGAWWVRFS